MALHFLDTSALAKRYVPERGSIWIRDLCVREQIAISEISFTEIASTLARRQREGRLSAAQVAVAWIELHRDARDYEIIPLTRRGVVRAGNYLLVNAMTVQLRSLDAVQLDAAREAFANVSMPSPGTFVAADQRLMVAAQSLGMRTADPNAYP